MKLIHSFFNSSTFLSKLIKHLTMQFFSIQWTAKNIVLIRITMILFYGSKQAII